jgi:carbonic anhydrase
MRYPLLLTALVALAWSLPGAAGEDAHHWSYEGESGPAHWGGTCQAGRIQSPIDIGSAKAPRVKLPALAFDYHPGALHIVDNGHTIQVRVAGGATLSVGGARFTLVQFHFHKPSEEAVDGKHFAMVVHLVHQDAAGHLAVVAVPLSAGHDNPVIASLWRHLPAEKGKEVSPPGVTIDPSGLLPASRAYFTFAGSLTTPPCTEGVRWFVLRSPGSVSAGEVAAFGKLYAANARPVQPLNHRKVLASE